MNKSLFLMACIVISLFSCNKKGDVANTDGVTTDTAPALEQKQVGKTAIETPEMVAAAERPQGVITYTEIDELRVNDLLVKNNLYKEDMAAQDFNAAGMYFYDKKQWYEAELMFSKATALYPYHVLANYNLACVLSIQCQSGKYEYRYDFWDILSRSVALEPGRGARARTDKDLEWYRLGNPKYFDEITLYNYEGKTQKVLSYNGILEGSSNSLLGFVDDTGRTYGFKDGYHNDGYFENFYSFKETEGDWNYVANEKLLGKKFEMYFFYAFVEAQGMDADGLDPEEALRLGLEPPQFGFGTNEIISMKEVK